MLRNVKDLQGYAIRATDGIIGKVDDFYFDDRAWTVRYLVVDTGALPLGESAARVLSKLQELALVRRY